MKILVVGGGGREHATVKSLAKEGRELFCAPGNAGIANLATCVDIKTNDVEGIVKFAVENKIDLAVVSQDEPLVLGMVDALQAAGIRAFGPNKAAAIIEGSKAFSKDLMKKYNIPTAAYEKFTEVAPAIAYLEAQNSYPAVIKARGHKVFLDLKLHDIPNTVKGGMRSLSGLGADIVNVHAAGTIDMMKAALEGVVREDGTRPLVIAVTQLTSTSEERMQNELLINASINDTIIHYAKNTKAAGLDGIVCSPLEAGMVKDACGTSFMTVTPGVRFADGEVGDQVRVTTPEKAKEIGSDYIVVGRPITEAADPVAAYRRCVAEFVG